MFKKLLLTFSLFLLPITITCQSKSDITFTVIYNNISYDPTLKTDWGFACLIDGFEKRILFDTGGSSEILLANMQSLSIDPKTIDIVVISHNHQDHTGGLGGLLNQNPEITLYLPPSFSPTTIQYYSKKGADAVIIRNPTELLPNIHIIGPLHENVTEQALAIESGDGSIIITGCSHPGIVNFVRQTKRVIDDDPFLVFGGFHLMRSSRKEIRTCINELRKLGVRKVGPTHCSGKQAINLFKTAFDSDYENMGAGRILTINH